LGLHSYDPGISPTLVVWTTPIPEESAQIDLEAGTAALHVSNIC